MTQEELAKRGRDASIAELRFYYEATGQDSERYDMLRLTLYRHWLETEPDKEFVKYASKRHGILKEAAAAQTQQQASLKLMGSAEFLDAIRGMDKKLHDDNSHPS